MTMWEQNLVNSLPFLVSLGGIATDYFTSMVGLGLGLYESQPLYSPAFALMIFWGALVFLSLALPRGRVWGAAKNVLASVTFLGPVNNTLVIFRVFPGLRI